MHALNRVSYVTGDSTYTQWAIELAKTAHARFIYDPPSGGQKRMYWKMSIDLTYPLVSSMGQHDPFDGLVTYSELQATNDDFGQLSLLDLGYEIGDIADICRNKNLATNDPLGIGGLLSDSIKIAQLIRKGRFVYTNLFEAFIEACLLGVDAFAASQSLELSSEYRLAFRELGLSIGLKGVKKLLEWTKENPDIFVEKDLIEQRVESLMTYLPIAEDIEQFWIDSRNEKHRSWTSHQDINMVMLATSLAPDEFLRI
ncbi:hypothetical protein [Methanobacterium sp.]|uniref:hypothetical protein n=1 Tax=Methanobacterium sp. TaxID=2164 RepID=UPI003C77E9B0